MTYTYHNLQSSPGFFSTDNRNVFTYPSTEGSVWTRPRDMKRFRYTDITDTFPDGFLENATEEFLQQYQDNYDSNNPNNGHIYEWKPIDHVMEETLGDEGFQGLRGLTGPKGPDGQQGKPGVEGGQGDPGPQGATGPVGVQGGKGIRGQYGISKCREAPYPDEYFTDDRGWLYISNVDKSNPKKSNQIFVSTGL